MGSEANQKPVHSPYTPDLSVLGESADLGVPTRDTVNAKRRGFPAVVTIPLPDTS